MYALPERPMNVFEVIKHACIFWANSLLKVLPLSMLYALLMATVDYFDAIPAEQSPYPVLIVLIPFICGLLGLMVLVAVFVKMNSELTGKPVLLRNAILIGIRRFISVIYWYFILFLIVGLPTLLLFTLGHFLGHPFYTFVDLLVPLYLFIAVIYLYPSFPLVAAENIVATTAVKQSFQLVKQQWWHTFFITVLSFAIMAIPLALLDKLQMLNNPVPMFIIMTFITSFISGVSLIQLRHLRDYHKLNGSLTL
jgi:hypothetical protein